MIVTFPIMVERDTKNKNAQDDVQDVVFTEVAMDKMTVVVHAPDDAYALTKKR